MFASHDVSARLGSSRLCWRLDCFVFKSIVMRDRDTGRSRGFGFVTFDNSESANAAITGLNDTELDGRRIKVNYANARPSGGAGGGGGGTCSFSSFF